MALFNSRERDRQAERRPQSTRNTVGGIGMSIGMVLIGIAAVLFALAAFGVAIGSVALIPLGLCLFALGHIVG